MVNASHPEPTGPEKDFRDDCLRRITVSYERLKNFVAIGANSLLIDRELAVLSLRITEMLGPTAYNLSAEQVRRDVKKLRGICENLNCYRPADNETCAECLAQLNRDFLGLDENHETR